MSTVSRNIDVLIVQGLLVLAFALFADLARAADTRVLERLDSRLVDGHVELEIGLTESYSYLNHSLSPGGMALQVELQQTQTGNPLDSEGRGFSKLNGSTVTDLPLQSVVTDSIGRQLFINLHFAAPVTVTNVYSGGNDRSVIVAVIKPVRAIQPGVPQDDGKPEAVAPTVEHYGIELCTVGAPAPLSATETALLLPGEFAYQFIARQGSVLRYRQMLGFFVDRETARARQQQLADVFGGSRVIPVSAPEREQVLQGNRLVDPAVVMINPDPGADVLPMSLERMANLMAEAKDSIAAGDLTRATTIYRRISVYPVWPYRQQALENRGLVEERQGRLRLARDTYETYLLQYPDGDGARRVRQRLAGVNAAMEPEQSRSFARRDSQRSSWDWFGGFGQYYRRDHLSQTGTDSLLTQSFISNDLNLSGRYRGESTDWRLLAGGSYDRDLLAGGEDEIRLSNLYLDFATRDQKHKARLGRQSRVAGILGRFDGLSYGYRLSSRIRMNVVAGLPVELSSDGLNGSRRVYGLNFDLGPIAENWNLNVYGVNQTLEGLLDRRAVGTEVRYFKDGRSLFSLIDYDLEFGELNIAYIVGTVPLGVGSSINFVADQRRSPLLSLRNALIGQGVDSFAQLQTQNDESTLRELARDRSGTSTSFTLGFNHRLSAVWQVGGDVSSSSFSSTPASGGVDAFPATGPDIYTNLRLVGNGWLSGRDVAIFGLRHVAASSYDGLAANLSYRLPISQRFNFNPLLRVEHRSLSNGETQWVYTPQLRLRYRPSRAWSLELETGYESYAIDSQGDSIKSDLLTIYAGYRYDF